MLVVSSKKRGFEEGEYALVYLDKKRRWLVKVAKGGKLHTHAGIVDLASLVGRPYGCSLESTLGNRLWALKPTMEDFLMKVERPTQVVYPKDLGLIVVKTGISSGSIVVEAGTGSGVLTGLMANLVRPDGHIYSFEARPEFLKVAKKNLEKMGLLQYVTLAEKDAKEGLDVKDADVGIVDVGDPWSLVKPFSESLAPSGVLAAVSPTMNQVEKLVAELLAQGFVDVESMELILRGLEARPNMTRPSMMMVGHTAYLTFARKTILEKE